MKNVFITGATSFIGINLIDELLNKNYDVTAIIRKNSINKKLLNEFKNIEIIELDLEEMNQLSNITNKKCDVFYHLAWNGTRGESRNNKELQENNYIYSINVLHEAKKLGCEVFISAGSQAEYGLHKELVTEQTKEEPVTEYGKYKLKFCNYSKEFCIKNNIRFIEPRFFSLYGIGDYEKTLVISTIDNMLKGNDINLTECTQLWNFLNIKDAVNALIKLQESNCFGVYNFGSEDTRTLKEFIYEIYKLTNSTSKINFGIIPYGKEGVVNVNPSIEKLQKDVNWSSEVTFEEGIKEIIEKRSRNEKN